MPQASLSPRAVPSPIHAEHLTTAELGAFVDRCAAAGYDPRSFRVTTETFDSEGGAKRIIGIERKQRTIFLDASQGDWIARVLQATREGRLGSADLWS